MIKLNNNQENIIVLTLSIDTDNTDASFLMNIFNDSTSFQLNDITLIDISTYKDRYNLFNIELVSIANINLALGRIYIKDAGFYKYEIYSDNTVHELLENGILYVIGNVLDVYTDDKNDNNSYFIYNN